jgi:uncharacterized protein YbjT (DUF2867 family)
MIDTRDIGNVAADVLLHRPCAKQTRELLGQRDLSYDELRPALAACAAVVQVLVLPIIGFVKPTVRQTGTL